VPGAKYSGVARFVISSDMVFLYGLLEIPPPRLHHGSTSLALLPEGARPMGVVQLLAIADGGDDDRDQMLLVVNVFPSGEVELAQQSTGRVRRVALDGVRFKAGAASVELDVPGGVDSQRPGGFTTRHNAQGGVAISIVCNLCADSEVLSTCPNCAVAYARSSV
jgi:hypothetical protein